MFEFAGALAQFIEQPGILDGDDGLCGKVLNYCNLFVSKRTHFLAKNGNASDQIVFFEHRNSKQSASASKVRETPTRLLWRRRDVGNMNNLLRCSDPAKRMFRAGMQDRFALSKLQVGWWRAMRSDQSEPAIVTDCQRTELGFANLRCVLQDRIEYRSQVAG